MNGNRDDRPVLLIRDLQKSFLAPQGAMSEVLRIPEFSLLPGEQFVLSGPSGSGKSTFLNCIAGITRPTRGEIYLCGKRIDCLREPEMDRVRAREIGYIFQSFNLLPGLTLLENLLLPMMISGDASRAKALDILEKVGLQGFGDYKPGQLSVGQKQRGAIARVLANTPKLILADEPTASLDSDHAHQVLRLIRQACERENTALLIVSHQASVAAQFQRQMDIRDMNFSSALAGGNECR